MHLSGWIVHDNKGAALGIIRGSINDELMLYATGSLAQIKDNKWIKKMNKRKHIESSAIYF